MSAARRSRGRGSGGDLSAARKNVEPLRPSGSGVPEAPTVAGDVEETQGVEEALPEEVLAGGELAHDEAQEVAAEEPAEDGVSSGEQARRGIVDEEHDDEVVDENEEVVDEEYDDDVVDEELTDDEVVDQDVVDEEFVDEDVVDEEFVDEDVAEQRADGCHGGGRRAGAEETTGAKGPKGRTVDPASREPETRRPRGPDAPALHGSDPL